MSSTMNPIKEAREIGQSIWLDFISRELITKGQLKELINEGVCGITSNPTIFNKAITKGTEYDEQIKNILKSNPFIDTQALYECLVIKDIQMAADILYPLYEKTNGMDGLVSVEISPHLAYDTQRTITEGRRLWNLVDRPNVMIKVPSTPQGIQAIKTLVSEGVNINITLVFSIKHYEAVVHAYTQGIAKSPHNISSVASFFVSRIDTYVDRELEKIGTKEALALRGKVAVAHSKLAYQRFREIFYKDKFSTQRQQDIPIQRVLWGSTSTKNPAYSDVLYVENLIGPDTINTMPLETLKAFLDHGKVRPTLEEKVDEAKKILDNLAEVGVNLDAITEQLQKDGVKAFIDSFDELIKTLENKRKKILTSKK